MPKYSPFEMAFIFDQKFALFIITNFHELQKVINTINAKLLLKKICEHQVFRFIIEKYVKKLIFQKKIYCFSKNAIGGAEGNNLSAPLLTFYRPAW